MIGMNEDAKDDRNVMRGEESLSYNLSIKEAFIERNTNLCKH